MYKSTLKILVFVSTFLSALNTYAQISVGLKESALGNSGVAITESSAPSYYNPALLSEKSKSYFSLTGTTLTSFKSNSTNGSFNSTKFAPNYLSSIHAFESFVQEFSLINLVSIDSKSTFPITNGTSSFDIKSDQYSLGYAMAFRNFPFGFQLGLRINESSFNINQNTNDGNLASGVTANSSQRMGHLFFGFGGIHQLGDNYRFGYKYESRGLKVYKKTDQAGTYYTYDKTNNVFKSGKSTITNASDDDSVTQTISLGHSFSVGPNEFLTDSRFIEKALSRNSYDFTQTFGYKISFSNKMQFMCGAAHSFNAESTDLSKSNMFSSGFAWQTNALRSNISAYHADAEDGTQIDGFTFGSEFVY